MGIVLWEVLARQRLMTGESAANTLHKLMNEPIPRVSHVIPAIDPVLDAIVAKALEKDPQLRWQSAAEMRDALEAWLRAQPRAARQEEVGYKMLSLFGSVREEVQRQVQLHMASITSATNTQELSALNAEALQRMGQTGAADVSGQLLRLGNGSGSGSGVVPNYGMGTGPSSAFPTGLSGQSMTGPPHIVRGSMSPANPATPPPRGNNALLIVLAVGFFLLAGLLIVVLGLNRRKEVAVEPRVVPTGVPVVSTTNTTGSPGATGTSLGTVPPVESATASPVDTAPLPPASAPTGKAPRLPIAAPRTTAVPHTTAPVPVPEEKENGFLTINVYPWAKVSEGGRVLCAATPCNKIPLSPGTHTLLLENADQGMKQSTTVTIRSGETTARAIGLK
jgi:serine/threonine-protein kinase